jgi:hypothetical protein
VSHRRLGAILVSAASALQGSQVRRACVHGPYLVLATGHHDRFQNSMRQEKQTRCEFLCRESYLFMRVTSVFANCRIPTLYQPVPNRRCSWKNPWRILGHCHRNCFNAGRFKKGIVGRCAATENGPICQDWSGRCRTTTPDLDSMHAMNSLPQTLLLSTIVHT